LNGWQYLIILTAFDRGDEDLHIESLESSFIENAVHVFPGTSPNNDANTEIGVYPNPYRLQAAWDGSTGTTGKIMFYNLPEHCTISIMTLSGDIVAELNHDAATYTGSDSEWFATYAGNEDERIFSGGEHAWNLLSESNQTITQGIYLFSVKDLDNGNIKQGRFAIIK
ncbi:MAG TPA: hypothetical protein PKE14_11660, partial [Chitinophagales bacterium]|nr:hypothetical protein [Chitinophagales bacterium]